MSLDTWALNLGTFPIEHPTLPHPYPQTSAQYLHQDQRNSTFAFQSIYISEHDHRMPLEPDCAAAQGNLRQVRALLQAQGEKTPHQEGNQSE